MKLGTFPSEEELASTMGEEGDEEVQPSSDQELPEFGMTVVPAEEGEGVVISDLDPSGVAAERGFRVGDTIVSVQNQPVSSADEISAAITEATESDRGAALFQIERDGDNRFVALPIEQG
jgi:serine protease Do